MKTEVIIQKSHRYGYDHAIRNCGIRFVEVETADDLERAAGDRTAMMLFFNAADPQGQIRAADFAALGRKHKIPTFNDAAADVPPVENLSKYLKMGFDLVTFSGGKGLRGPQSAGLLLGRGDLIEAARLNARPYSDSIGRGMKVNKEELLGMMAAVEVYIKKRPRRRVARVGKAREDDRRRRGAAAGHQDRDVRSGDRQCRAAPAHPVGRSGAQDRPGDVTKRLREGEPSIEVRPGAKDCLEIAVWMLQPGEAQTVGRRIREVLKGG